MKKWQFKKSHILYAVELVVILVLVCGALFVKDETILQIPGNEITEVLSGENGQQEWRSDDMQLKGGVYRLNVRVRIPEGSYLTVVLENREIKVFKEIMANSVVMRGNGTEFEQQITVSAGVEAAYLRIVCYGDLQGFVFDGVTLNRTSGVYSVLAVFAVVLATFVNLLLYFHRLVVEKRISGEQQVVVWLLAATVLLAMFPYLTDCITVGEGTNHYLNRIETARYALREGRFAFADLCLLLPVFLRMFGFTVMSAYKLFVFAVSIITVVVTYYCLKHCTEERKAALLGTVLYVLFPYRIYSFYNTGNIAECLAMIFLLPVVCGAYLLCTGKVVRERLQYGVMYLAAGLIGLLPCCMLSAASAKAVAEKGGAISCVAFSGMTMLAFAAVLCALGVAIWLKSIKSEKLKCTVTILLSVLVLGIGIYQVNDIALYMTPSYWYNIETPAVDAMVDMEKEG